MAIVNGTTITAADINTIWPTALTTLRRDIANAVTASDKNTYKQFTEVFSFNKIKSTTAEYLRTIVYVPRTDVILRSARISTRSYTAGLTTSAAAQAGVPATVTIPAQIIQDYRVVGGNIKKTLTATATSNAGASFGASGAIISLPNTETFTFLAGDNIDIVVSTPEPLYDNYITVSLTFETNLMS